MNDISLKALLLCTVLVTPTALLAQTAATSEEPVEAAEIESDEALMTAEELQTLVGPIALYPDTLLIQVLVAATYPLDVVKADRLVKGNEGATPEELKPLVEAEGWDESVAVLAEAFPEVLSEMALHVEWTETIGTAMLAQSDDVMEAVQNRREAANEAGTLVSGEEQTVEVAQAENGSETIIIQPTDPEIVYVPQYDSNVVYVQDNNSTDLITAGLVGFGAFVLMDAIFDNDDPWNDYWGCRSCGGWGGGPIYARPGAGGINVDGDVNIGNNVGNNVGWKPEEKRQKDAKKKISNKRGEDGKTKLPVNKGPNRGDDMRSNLSSKTGAKDISRSAKPREAVGGANLAAGAAAGGLAAGGIAAASSNKKKAAVNRTGAAPAKAGAKKATPAKKQAAAKKAPAAKKTGVAQKTKTAKKPAAKRTTSKPTAMKKRPSSHKAGSGGSRGRASSGGRKRR